MAGQIAEVLSILFYLCRPKGEFRVHFWVKVWRRIG